MRPQDIISIKRDGGRLGREEIDAFVRGVIDGSWADYQISALIMAMFLNELDFEEQSLITSAMLHSGSILDFSDIDKPKADKHSTGGVGDKTSLMIAPLAAACGLAVPMISGRGLGHTGGTLDKLESIPGYDVKLPTDRFKRIVREIGFAMSGQTEEIAPADRKIYSLRDATATVPTIPLIVASIMSKKLAEGLDALVLDVKTGSGAFMKEEEEALRLAKEMVNTGNSFGVRTRALITDMSRPLGRFVGNSLEVYECVRLLRNEGDDLMSPTAALSKDLTAHMLVVAGQAASHSEAIGMVDEALTSGRAFETFARNVEAQGGDASICEDPLKLVDDSLDVLEVVSNSDGFVGSIRTELIGNVVSAIGGGRIRAEDEIDRAVGFSCETRLGAEVKSGDVLGTVYTRSDADASYAVERLRSAFVIQEEPAEEPGLVIDVVKGQVAAESPQMTAK